MKKRRAIKLESETRRSWPEGGTTGRETKNWKSLGALAGAIMEKIGQDRRER